MPRLAHANRHESHQRVMSGAGLNVSDVSRHVQIELVGFDLAHDLGDRKVLGSHRPLLARASQPSEKIVSRHCVNP